MGSTLLAALVRSGHDPADLVVSDTSVERARQVAEEHGARAASSTEAVEGADVVVLAVKPQDMSGLIEEIHDHVRPHTLVVSIAAPISTDFLERRLPDGTSVVRVMPNTPVVTQRVDHHQLLGLGVLVVVEAPDAHRPAVVGRPETEA